MDRILNGHGQTQTVHGSMQSSRRSRVKSQETPAFSKIERAGSSQYVVESRPLSHPSDRSFNIKSIGRRDATQRRDATNFKRASAKAENLACNLILFNNLVRCVREAGSAAWRSGESFYPHYYSSISPWHGLSLLGFEKEGRMGCMILAKALAWAQSTTFVIAALRLGAAAAGFFGAALLGPSRVPPRALLVPAVNSRNLRQPCQQPLRLLRAHLGR